MVTLIHSADVHLTADEADRDYSLTVLDEVIETTNATGADYLLLAGDVFDSFADAEQLRGSFRERMQSVNASVLMIPGNHEDLRRGHASLSTLDLGDVTLVDRQPFQLLSHAEVEFLMLPFRDNYADYLSWQVPPKAADWRVAVGHGSVAGIGLPFSEEDEAGALDWDLLERFEVDYAAMGHVHSTTQSRRERRILAYPGSPRVWRRGEEGPRQILRVSLGDGIEVEPVPIAAAGRYRRIRLQLRFDGACPEIEGELSVCGAGDWADVELTGVVEDEHAAAALDGQVHDRLTGRVRRIDVTRDRIQVAAGISAHPIAARFLEAWQQAKPDEPGAEREAWLRARELGLNAIKDALESQS